MTVRYLPGVWAVLVSGCATWFPAHVTDLGDDRYAIQASGNSFASPNKMKQKIDEKAGTLCGARGFDYDEGPSIEWKEEVDYASGMETFYQNAFDLAGLVVAQKGVVAGGVVVPRDPAGVVVVKGDENAADRNSAVPALSGLWPAA